MVDEINKNNREPSKQKLEEYKKENIPKIKEVLRDIRNVWLGKPLLEFMARTSIKRILNGVVLTASFPNVYLAILLRPDRQFDLVLTIDRLDNNKTVYEYTLPDLEQVKQKIADLYAQGAFPELHKK